MIDRFAKLPSSLTDKARTVRLAGDIPALLVHPNWIDSVPTIIWMHGRTANKELDAGRYVRWMKAGMGACAIDLPGHGERGDARAEAPGSALDVLGELIPEIDRVVEALADPVWQNVFDLDRLGIGGMSLGGMAALRRLCEPHPPHPFGCAAVESTTGDLTGLYREGGPRPWGTSYPLERIAPLDPQLHMAGFAPVPLLALHSEADRIVPVGLQRGYLDRLRAHYAAQGADPNLVTLHTWPTTGAPEEHSGFGRVGNEAKNLQTEFFARHLLGPRGSMLD
jgi:alpha-beta hydrolase superfamily lysophospholipase